MFTLLIALYVTPVQMTNDKPVTFTRDFTTNAECEQFKTNLTPDLNQALENGLIAYTVTCQQN